MVTKTVLAGILFPIAIYVCLAGIFLFILACALYVCVTAFRRFVHKLYRKLKLLYWPEQTFNFLGLPPEIRVEVYRYTLPKDNIYCMTARKFRFYGRQDEFIEDEVTRPLPSLLRVCRLVHEELCPIIYGRGIFCITIYSIRDLLYILDLLEKYATPTTFHSTSIFSMMRQIVLRVNNVLAGIVFRLPIRTISRTLCMTSIWHGRGKALLRDGATAMRMIKMDARLRYRRVPWFEAEDLRHLLECIFEDGALDRRALVKMLPWYQRHQSCQARRKASLSPV
ncbi:hypothetical protein E4T49_06633 [Aureobasidium sp. EXF-10728]|nr:hypothetical protein E4T49_06633 [Aureobasidium sp. EXF-10728]